MIIGGIFRCICINEKCKGYDDTNYFSFDENGNIKDLCPNCNKKTLIKYVSLSNETMAIGGKHKKGRSEKEKSERRLKSLKNEVYPTLKGFDKEYFRKKYNFKK